jgi:CBS domain-containing protein
MKASDLMQKGVVVVSPELGLDQFEELLTSEDISGAPVIDTNGALVGIASKTDIVRALSEELRERSDSDLGSNLTVEDIMSGEVVTVGPNEDAKVIARKMIDGHLHRVLVVNETDVIGIVTSLDLLRLLA